jgi:hypothetical protein
MIQPEPDKVLVVRRERASAPYDLQTGIKCLTGPVVVLKRAMMTPATLNTILNTAPMIIQGAGKLLRLIREREDETTAEKESLPVSVEGLKLQIKQIEKSLHENYRSDVEQIRLIEQLAKQNESLAETLKQTYRKITVLTYLSVTAVCISAVAIVILLTGS